MLLKPLRTVLFLGTLKKGFLPQDIIILFLFLVQDPPELSLFLQHETEDSLYEQRQNHPLPVAV